MLTLRVLKARGAPLRRAAWALLELARDGRGAEMDGCECSDALDLSMDPTVDSVERVETPLWPAAWWMTRF